MAKSESKEKKVMKKDTKIRLILIGVVVLVIVLSIVYVNFTSKDTPKNEEQGSNSQSEENIDEVSSTIDFKNLDNATVEGNTKTNNSTKMKEEKKVDNMKVKVEDLKAQNGISNFIATVENTSGKEFKTKSILIKFINKDGTEYATLEGVIGDVESGGTTIIDASTTADIINAYDYSIEIKE